MKLFRNLNFFSKNLQAHKFMKSIAQKALSFKPKQLREFTRQQTLADRVVKTFFTSSNQQIHIFQAKDRITTHTEYSTPSHSYYQVILPFQQNTALKNKFVKFYTNGVRIGRILQIMDYMAANVAYRYCSTNPSKINQSPNFTIVTACVDQINFFLPLTADKNCIFSGYVTSVGTSSIEVQVDVKQINQKGDEILNCNALFVMVARDKVTHSRYNVPPMQLQNQDNITKVNYQLGITRQQKRKQLSMRSLYSVSPSFQQSKQVHQIYLKSQKNQFPDHSVQISSTKLEKILLMHSQNRNLHGKIFGGYIMRQAFQIGWLCAYMYLKGKSYPQIYHIDDIQFLTSVQVGSSIKFEAVVCYTKNYLIHVIVKCICVKPDGSKIRTNELRLSFLGPNDWKDIVLPVTYGEAILYLQGKRAIEQLKN